MFNSRRVSLSVLAGAALAVPLALAGASIPAYADAAVSDWNTLQTEVAGAIAADTITLTSGITSDPDESLLVNVGAAVTINLAGNDLTIIEPASGDAAIGVPAGATLIINDSVGGGTLTATGGIYGAGIGGGDEEDAGVITINGGTVVASGIGNDVDEAGGAGIGGGATGSGGIVTVNGGTVTANGGYDSAGIGGGGSDYDIGGDGGTLTVNGGAVVANGGLDAAGIGGGYGDSVSGDGGTVTIIGGTVTATGNGGGAGIGGGGGTVPGDGGTVTITGGTVTATGIIDTSGIGAGIGGPGGAPGSLLISGTPDGTASTGGGPTGAPITDTAPNPAGLFYTATVTALAATNAVQFEVFFHTVSLADTGFNVAPLVWIALALLFAGGVVLAICRVRRAN